MVTERNMNMITGCWLAAEGDLQGVLLNVLLQFHFLFIFGGLTLILVSS